jgi:hypothetical protein
VIEEESANRHMRRKTYSAYSAFSALLFETSKSTGKSAPLRGGRNSGTGRLLHSHRGGVLPAWLATAFGILTVPVVNFHMCIQSEHSASEKNNLR